MAKPITMITRADDCGSNHSANLGILKALEGGVLKNVSLMAPCNSIHEAADLFAARKDICFGLHFTINAEWDNVKWGPVSDPVRVATLIGSDGYFFQHPRCFKERTPSMGEVLFELEAQMKKLEDLGFRISYVDTHMAPELTIPGLEDELRAWCSNNGYRYWLDYFSKSIVLPASSDPVNDHIDQLDSLEAGQYLLVTHPATDSEEVRALGNREESGPQIAETRYKDCLFWADSRLAAEYERRGIRPIRYDEAEKTGGSVTKL